MTRIMSSLVIIRTKRIRGDDDHEMEMYQGGVSLQDLVVDRPKPSSQRRIRTLKTSLANNYSVFFLYCIENIS